MSTVQAEDTYRQTMCVLDASRAQLLATRRATTSVSWSDTKKQAILTAEAYGTASQELGDAPAKWPGQLDPAVDPVSSAQQSLRQDLLVNQAVLRLLIGAETRAAADDAWNQWLSLPDTARREVEILLGHPRWRSWQRHCQRYLR